MARKVLLEANFAIRSIGFQRAGQAKGFMEVIRDFFRRFRR